MKCHQEVLLLTHYSSAPSFLGLLWSWKSPDENHRVIQAGKDFQDPQAQPYSLQPDPSNCKDSVIL